ncbi:MAG TPA: cupin domain-containing protein [Gaiellaceae bacterium]|nr:cupin domain-containing protein [Gaiellaceae bacterium]
MQVDLLGDEFSSESDHPGFRWRRMRAAGEHLGASLYELPPGERTFPYHYELGNDELLVVVSGRPTLRDPDGERELAPGDCILFPSGPAGAHQVVNRSNDSVRVLIASSFAMPRGAVQVDSGKMMLRWSPEPDDRLWVRLYDTVDYWEGEDAG